MTLIRSLGRDSAGKGNASKTISEDPDLINGSEGGISRMMEGDCPS
jgi:hypothetical protein